MVILLYGTTLNSVYITETTIRPNVYELNMHKNMITQMQYPGCIISSDPTKKQLETCTCQLLNFYKYDSYEEQDY